jgi:hypothetical protein
MIQAMYSLCDAHLLKKMRNLFSSEKLVIYKLKIAI